MKLIKNDLYLLLIDEEAEIKEGDYVTGDGIHYLSGVVNKVTQIHNGGIIVNKFTKLSMKGNLKVIAYYPLTKEAKELDLPLLPPFRLKDAIFKLAKEYSDKTNKHSSELYPHCDETLEEITINDFIAGYKAAQSKQQEVINFLITLKDSIESFEYSVNQNSYLDEKIDEFIQSLSTQQLPKEFIPQYEVDINCKLTDMEYGFIENDFITERDIRESWYKKLKTIINSEGREEIQGTYKY